MSYSKAEVFRYDYHASSLRAVIVASSSILTPLTLYYLGVPLPIIISWKRASFTVYLASPIAGSTLIDVLLLTITSIILIVFNVKDRLGKIVFSIAVLTLALTGYILSTLTLEPHYLLLVGLAGLLSLISSLYMGLRQLVLHGIAFSIIALSSITSILMILFFLGLLDKNVAYVIVLYWRGIWRVIEWVSTYLLIVIGLYWFAALVLRRKHSSKLVFKNSIGSDSSKRFPKPALIVAVAIPSMLVALLHLPSFNPHFAPISVDTFFYARALTSSQSLSSALLQFSGTRPLYMAIIYPAYVIIQDPILLMDVIHPAIVLGLLVYASYRLARKYYGENTAVLAALLTALGPNILTFIAGGFQANSLALAIMLIAWSLEDEGKQLILRIILYLMVAFIHPWTFTMYLVAETLFRWWRRDSLVKVFTSIIMLASASILLSIVGPAIMNTVGMQSYVYMLLLKNVRIVYPIGLNINRAVEIMTWGSLSNPFIYSLTIASYPTLTIIHSLLAASSPIMFVASKTIIHRLLLNIPLSILAAQVLEDKSRTIKLAIILACLAQTLTLMPAFTPLTTPPWTNIFNPW